MKDGPLHKIEKPWLKRKRTITYYKINQRTSLLLWLHNPQCSKDLAFLLTFFNWNLLIFLLILLCFGPVHITGEHYLHGILFSQDHQLCSNELMRVLNYEFWTYSPLNFSCTFWSFCLIVEDFIQPVVRRALGGSNRNPMIVDGHDIGGKK